MAVDPTGAASPAAFTRTITLEPQTTGRQRDPATIGTSQTLDEVLDARAAKASEVKDGFEAYLNQGGLIQTMQTGDTVAFDPVKELERQSVYIQLGETQPI